MSSVRVVFMTAPDRATAERLGDALVRERLAACANVLPGVSSIYWWDGATDTPKLLKDLPPYKRDGDELKPEAILPLNQTSAGLRVLILFDGAKEGGPRAIEVAKP